MCGSYLTGSTIMTSFPSSALKLHLSLSPCLRLNWLIMNIGTVVLRLLDLLVAGFRTVSLCVIG